MRVGCGQWAVGNIGEETPGVDLEITKTDNEFYVFSFLPPDL